MNYRTWWIRTFHLHRKAKFQDVVPGHVIIQAMIIKESRDTNAAKKGERK